MRYLFLVEQLLEHLFAECETYGKVLVEEGVITAADVTEISQPGMIRVGLPAYAILRTLLQSAKEETDGIILSDNTEITMANKPKDTFFDWFFEPLLVMKQQIQAENLSDQEEFYLCKLILLSGDSLRIKELNACSPIINGDRRRAELDAITRRYPVFPLHQLAHAQSLSLCETENLSSVLSLSFSLSFESVQLSLSRSL